MDGLGKASELRPGEAEVCFKVLKVFLISREQILREGWGKNVPSKAIPKLRHHAAHSPAAAPAPAAATSSSSATVVRLWFRYATVVLSLGSSMSVSLESDW